MVIFVIVENRITEVGTLVPSCPLKIRKKKKDW